LDDIGIKGNGLVLGTGLKNPPEVDDKGSKRAITMKTIPISELAYGLKEYLNILKRKML
jgi:hypothetical protein